MTELLPGMTESFPDKISLSLRGVSAGSDLFSQRHGHPEARAPKQRIPKHERSQRVREESRGEQRKPGVGGILSRQVMAVMSTGVWSKPVVTRPRRPNPKGSSYENQAMSLRFFAQRAQRGNLPARARLHASSMHPAINYL